MRRADRVFDLLMVLVCGLYLVSSLGLDMGTMKDSGPGFIPMLLGVSGLVVSILVVRNSLKNTADREAKEVSEVSKEGKMRYLGCILACILFIPMFENLGPVISVFALILALTKVWGAQGWLKPVLLSVVSSGTVYALFSILLEVPFPRGIF